MRKGDVIVIDPPVTFALAPAGDMIVLDLWDGATPAAPVGARLLPVEPNRWWLIDSAEHAAALAERIGATGALTAIGGGLTRATLTGVGWRALLTVSGCFDVENSRFAPGMVAATAIHHVPVWIAPITEDVCEVFLANSYAPTLADLWSRVATGKGA